MRGPSDDKSPAIGLVDVFAATLPALKFKPGVHINYAETVLPIRDGLPKFKDFPTEFGGSGTQIAEQTKLRKNFHRIDEFVLHSGRRL